AEADKLQQERQQWATQKYQETNRELTQKAETSIRSKIERVIDPKGSMSEFVKHHAIQEAFNDMTAVIRNDRSFQIIIQKCWNNIWANNYSHDSVDKLLRVWQAKAQTVLPQSIQKARRVALKGTRAGSRESKPEAKTSFKNTGESAVPKKTAPVTKEGKKMST